MIKIIKTTVKIVIHLFKMTIKLDHIILMGKIKALKILKLIKFKRTSKRTNATIINLTVVLIKKIIVNCSYDL